jgi:hypothetical protein
MTLEKPTVLYKDLVSAEVGYRAILYPINHPNHLNGHQVTNLKYVLTSVVKEYDPVSGRIETENSIYFPEVKEDQTRTEHPQTTTQT